MFLNVIVNYGYKTSVNGILVLNESYNILLPLVKIPEKTVCFIFWNIGLNIKWCGVLFTFFFLSKIDPRIVYLDGNVKTKEHTHSMIFLNLALNEIN